MKHQLQAQQEAFDIKARAQVDAEQEEVMHKYSQKQTQGKTPATVHTQQQVEEPAPARAAPGATSSQSKQTAPGMTRSPARARPSSQAKLPEGMQQHFFICKCSLSEPLQRQAGVEFYLPPTKKPTARAQAGIRQTASVLSW